MTIMTRTFVIILAILIVATVYFKTKKKMFSETGSIAWMLFSVFVLLIAVFPTSLDWLSLLVGIQYAPSFLFLLALVFLLYIAIRQSQAITILSKRNEELAQNIALLDEQIRRIEEEKASRE